MKRAALRALYVPALLWASMAALFPATLSGLVADERGQPLAGVRITLSERATGRVVAEFVTAADGVFVWRLLRPCRYRLLIEHPGCELGQAELEVKESTATDIRVVLQKRNQSAPAAVSVRLVRRDLLDPHSAPVVGPAEVARYPGARDVSSLLDTQAVAAVVNRIDVGGGKGEEPARLAAHGSSWTQTTFRLNGLDVTDTVTRGQPLFEPPFAAIREVRAVADVHPAVLRGPGVEADVLTSRRAEKRQGTAYLFYQGGATQFDRPSSRLLRQGIPEKERLRDDLEAGLDHSGRAAGFGYTGAVTTRRRAKRTPGFPESIHFNLVGATVALDGLPNPRHETGLFAGLHERNDDFWGADFRTSPSATWRGEDRSFVIQGRWRWSAGRRLTVEGRTGFVGAAIARLFQPGPAAQEPNSLDLFTQYQSGAAAFQERSRRKRLSAALSAEWLALSPTGLNQRVKVGWEMSGARAASELDARGDLQLRFLPDDLAEHPWRRGSSQASAIVEYNTPVRPRQAVRELAWSVGYLANLGERLVLSSGLRLETTGGWLPRQSSPAGNHAGQREEAATSSVIAWRGLAPRAGTALLLSRRAMTVVRGGFGLYRHALPGFYLDFANSNSLGGRVYEWTDLNQDRRYQPPERGRLQRAFGGPVSGIDADLRQPWTQELVLGVTQPLPLGLCLRADFMSRRQHDLIETINVGVPFSAYAPERVLDPGGDGVFGTSDDREVTVYNQRTETLGQDRYLLTNPERFEASHKEALVTLNGAWTERISFSLAFSALKSLSRTSPGNSEWENDPGMVGSLFDNPNSLINSRNRPFFDRGFTSKLAVLYRAPGEWRVGLLARYYDGLPFGRRLVVLGFNQGPFFVHATPRGDPVGHRTEYNLTADLRLRRSFALAKGPRLTLVIDVFNLLNSDQKTRENDLTGPLFPLRVPLEVQAPRVIRLGAEVDF